MKTLITLFSILLVPALAMAGGNAVVNWSNPSEYKDVEASSGSQAEFQTKTFAELEATIQKLASSLPDAQQLEMTITDLDLAGEVKLSGARTQHQDVRVVRDMYPAKIKFHYRLLDAGGNVIKEGNEKLQSRSMSASLRTGSGEPLEMEKRMLIDWFKRSIAK